MKKENKHFYKNLYPIVCRNNKEVICCIKLLKKLGLFIKDIEYCYKDETMTAYIYYESQIASFQENNKNSYHYVSFEKFQEMVKNPEKEYESDELGRITKIYNYYSETKLFFINSNWIYDTKEIIEEESIKYLYHRINSVVLKEGFLFNTKENAEKFLQYIRNYSKAYGSNF